MKTLAITSEFIENLIEAAEATDDVETKQSVYLIIPNNDATYAAIARLGRGLHYESAEWTSLCDAYSQGGWSQFWPVIDRDGNLTGEITDSDGDYLNVHDEAMISREEAYNGRWLVKNGYASPSKKND